MIRRLVPIACAVCCLFGLGVPARAIDTRSVVVAYQKYTLPNGLEVILSHDSRLPIVTVNLWYHVGALEEQPGHTGFAHLFEHMMFEGSAHVPSGRHLALLERAGATDLNATTDFDRTNYFETVPANYLETALWLESDRMGYLLDALTEKKFDLQREVVKNERRQHVEDTPYGLAEEKAWAALFPAPHPYSGDVMGSMADLDAATLDDVRAFFRAFYAPSNATLTLVGDFDPLRVRQTIAKYFGSLPSQPRPKPPVIPELHFEHAVELQETLRAGTPAFVWLGWHSPKALTQADAAADVLAGILTQGKSSRLQRRLIQDQQLAQSVQAQQLSLAAQSAFSIEAVARPGVTADRLQAEISAELAAIRAHGVTPQEVERSRRVIETEIVRSLQSHSGLADRLQYYNQYTGDPGYFERDLARYDAVTPEAVRDVAARVLGPDSVVALTAEPAHP